MVVASVIRKVMNASLNVLRITKRELEKEVSGLVSKKLIRSAKAKQVLKDLYKEFKSGSSRIQKFGLRELNREFKKTKKILEIARKSNVKKKAKKK